MIFGTRDVRSLYMAGTRITIAKEISKYKLDLTEVREVRLGKGGAGVMSSF
jgi:hypothetical protein